MKQVLVTGNLGYIGVMMTEHLRANGYSVIGLDSNLYKNAALCPLEEAFLPHRQILKDIRHLSLSDLKGVDAVVHLAALSNDPLGDLNFGLTEEINLNATVQLARLCKQEGIQKLVYASSCSVYGASSSEKVTEKGKISPLTAYARTKILAENELLKLSDETFCPTIMRNATVYGFSPMLRMDLVANQLAASAFLTQEIQVLSDGTPWRPLLHIRDFCQAFLAVLEAPRDRVHGEIFNVGSAQNNFQVQQIAEQIKFILPVAQIRILNRTGPDPRSYRVDFSKIEKRLLFKCQWYLQQGIEDLISAFRKYHLTVKDFDSNKFFRLRMIQSLLNNNQIDASLYWRN